MTGASRCLVVKRLSVRNTGAVSVTGLSGAQGSEARPLGSSSCWRADTGAPRRHRVDQTRVDGGLNAPSVNSGTALLLSISAAMRRSS